MVEKGSKAARKEEVVTREYTINLHKRLHGWYSLFPLSI
jgi:large subunit ribosomal protein L31e